MLLPLRSRRLLLRRLGVGDLEGFLTYRGDPEVARFQGWEAFSREQALAFLQRQEGQVPGVPGEWLQIGIVVQETQELVGDCALKLHAPDARQATIGITLARAFQGKGFATETLSTLFDHLFVEMRLHRVQADTDPENQASWRLLERLGMRREAHLKQSLWFKGRWADEYIYAVLREEWRAPGNSQRQVPGRNCF